MLRPGGRLGVGMWKGENDTYTIQYPRNNLGLRQSHSCTGRPDC